MCRDVSESLLCILIPARYLLHGRIHPISTFGYCQDSWNLIMEANYDEDLSENPFLQELKKDYLSTFQKATSEGWIICVPRRGSFTKGGFLENDFFEHILIPRDKDSNTTHFQTLNGKEVKLANRVLTVEYDIAKSYSAHLLFEETFYTSDRRKYRIWCIEHPLEQGTLTSNDFLGTVTNLRECLDFLWTEILEKTILKELESEIKSFECSQTDFESKTLQEQRDAIGSLYATGLRIILKDIRLRERTTSDRHILQNVKIAIETYILHGLRKLLSKSVSACTAFEDASLNKIIKNLYELQLTDLGIRSDLFDGVHRGKLELSRLNSFTTVLGKIECLKRSVRYISQGISSMSSDDLLPVLIYLVIKAGLPNWTAQLAFMKHFRFSANSIYETDEAGFLLTSLEAAVEHVRSDVLRTTTGSEDIVEELDLSQIFKANVQSEVTLRYLFRCIRMDDLNEVERILTKKSSLPKEEINLCHPLCTCESCEKRLAWNRHSNWPTVYSRDDRGLAPLHLAALCGHVKIVDFLLNNGANTSEVDAEGFTALHSACMRGHQNTVLLLLHANADPTIADTRKNTPLHLASDHGHEGCVKALLYFAEQTRIPLDTSSANINGDTPLHHAAKWGYAGIVGILLEYGAHCRATNKRGQTPLAVAHSVHVAELLEHANSQNNSGPIHRTLYPLPQLSRPESLNGTQDKVENIPRNKHTIERLLSAINEKDIRLACYYLGLNSQGTRSTPSKAYCHPLCDCDRCTSLDESLEKQQRVPAIGINACNCNGETALHAASNVGCVEIVQLLLDAGANINAVTKDGKTPLHMACTDNRIQVVKVLLNCSTCDVNAKDHCGDTPLHLAVKTENMKLVECLLRYGANPKFCNNYGLTALQVIEKKTSDICDSSIYKLLKKNSLHIE
ncbi:ankyrin repeat domain-containing protein 27-like [Prorops nasuta]|uniref:ankyrin repeat domain-containing protein 27-like n=1 Tax=Prorops nasuta TaxID=863751 RepID=UPI0034CDB14A